MFEFLKKLYNSAMGKLGIAMYKKKNDNIITDEVINALDEELEDKEG